MRPLAVAAPQRLPAWPDVPTLDEVGFPGFRPSQWSAAFAPAGVPREIIDKLHDAFAAAAKTPEMQAIFEKGGMIAPGDKSVDDATRLAEEGNGNLAARHRRCRDQGAMSERDMRQLKIGILLGDDIGLEVVPECVKVMKAAAAKTGLDIEWHELPIGKAGHEQHGNTLPKITEETLHTLDGWIMGPIGHNAYPRGDMTWVMPPVRKKFDLFTALRPVAVASDHPVGAQERRHRVLPRTDRRHALFRDRGRGPARVPAERRHHHRVARHHPQGLEPRRPRGVRDRPHAPAQEGHRRAQGAGLSARLRHVRRGMPQGREGISGRRSSRR